MSQVLDIPLDEIHYDDEFNCRGGISAHEVQELAASIRVNGLLEPIIVRPWIRVPGKKYHLIAGHRRFKAHQVLGRATIECLIKEGMSDLDARKANIIENLDRQNLNILQEAKALFPFYTAGWRQQQVARELGKPQAWVKVRFDLLTLPEEIQKEAAAGYLSQEHIKQLVKLRSSEGQFEAVRRIKTAKLNGDKVGRIFKKKANPHAKHARTAQEIFAMQSKIQDAISGNNFGTRCLAWAAGEISDHELYEDVRELAPFWSPNVEEALA